MIQLPKRSVTRFFIPLIDVLILLFCVFLFLPMVGQGDTPDSSLITKAETVDKLKIADSTSQLLKEIEKLRSERTEAFRGAVFSRVLEIDSTTGELFFRNPDKSILKNKDDVSSLINQDKLSSKGKELFYMVLYPRDLDSSYPTSAGLMASFGLLIFQASYPTGKRHVHSCSSERNHRFHPSS